MEVVSRRSRSCSESARALNYFIPDIVTEAEQWPEVTGASCFSPTWAGQDRHPGVLDHQWGFIKNLGCFSTHPGIVKGGRTSLRPASVREAATGNGWSLKGAGMAITMEVRWGEWAQRTVMCRFDISQKGPTSPSQEGALQASFLVLWLVCGWGWSRPSPGCRTAWL